MKHPDMQILFDAAWYAHRNRLKGADAWLHFVEQRAHGFEPNPLFDSRWFKTANPKVARIDPLVHFLQSRSAKPVSPSPLFEVDWYLDRYPDVLAAGVDPYKHYLQWGRHEGRLPNQWCDPEYRGASVMDLTVPDGFSIEDLLGYIPHYTTLRRLVSGGEAGAFFCPQRPFWIAAEPVSGGAQFSSEECVILGGRPEFFDGERVYLPCTQNSAPHGVKAFQVRYAISPIIRDAITVVGQDLNSEEAIIRVCKKITQVVGNLPDVPTSEINVVADKIFAPLLRSRLIESCSVPLNVVALDNGYLCRLKLLEQRTR